MAFPSSVPFAGVYVTTLPLVTAESSACAPAGCVPSAMLRLFWLGSTGGGATRCARWLGCVTWKMQVVVRKACGLCVSWQAQGGGAAGLRGQGLVNSQG